jgi:mannose-6-phosphate isomerase-like protein (cupin superfamily)
MSSLFDPAATLPPPVVAGDRFEVMGTVITFRKTAADTDGVKTTFDMIAPPGVGVPMHVHEHEDELFVIRRGKVRFVVDGKVTLAGPGETAYGPKNVPHSWEAIGADDLEATVAMLPAKLEEMFRDLAELPKGLPDLARIASICAAHGIRFV